MTRSMMPWMELAIAEAAAAATRGEVPVGAVVVSAEGVLLARSGNRTEQACDPTAHAELLALRAAGQALRSPRLSLCSLYVTLEPCPLCAQAISLFRIRRLVFGAYDPKGGGVEHGPRLLDAAGSHRPEIVGGVRESDCAALLRDFFVRRRS